jgi:hypothetical protein
VIHAANGPITSVPVERTVERALGLGRVAAVGVGPVGTQQLVVVIEQAGASDGPADAETSDRVRQVVADRLGCTVASVLAVSALPVDIRHNAKIDRTKVAGWATDLLAGRRVRPLG